MFPIIHSNVGMLELTPHICTLTEYLILMDNNTEIWRHYYEKTLSHKHSPRTELASKLNESNFKVAIDCGCGTGSDVFYLAQLGYQVYGFDINPDSISICRKRFGNDPLVEISQASFENYDYPTCGLIVANSSLYFAEPTHFKKTWDSLTSSLVNGGVFAGDFMGMNDSWAANYRSPTAPLTKHQVLDLFDGFEIIRFHERDELGKTSIGKMKHWHTFSLVAEKCT